MSKPKTPARHEAWWTCSDCGKRAYGSKADAKKVQSRVASGREGLHAYRCGDAWHLGHKPPDLVAGRASRADLEASHQW